LKKYNNFNTTYNIDFDYYYNNQNPIVNWIDKMFKHAEKRKWFETYWAIDIHGTISVPDYRKKSKEIIYYPYAKETLQLLSNRKDIILILSTSSYPDEIQTYMEQFAEDNIYFKYLNENPEISSYKGSYGFYEQKYYFNVLIDDKAGFNPEKDWKKIYNYFLNNNYKPNSKWKMKYKEDYHK